ncbi:MAG: hypothetical protein LBQ28_04690 [Prevotellaceae bacterium]|nr:hypothetical protein [Prevotellaceae bacterium]
MININDITKCNNEDCPLCYDCKRHMTPTNEFNQSWATFTFDEEKGACQYFIEIYKHTKK